MVQTPEKRKFMRLREKDNEIQRQERAREATLRLHQEHLARLKRAVDRARGMEWLRQYRARENDARARETQSK